jgi:mono/diheme cytochrome c family protein
MCLFWCFPHLIPAANIRIEEDRLLMLHLLTCVLLLAQETLAGKSAEEPPASVEAVQHFESRVRPILIDNCHDCHGVKKQWAGLRLDSREAILKGGDTGPAVLPGQPDQSLLIRAVRHDDEALQMPQDDKLSDIQIAELIRWVERTGVSGITGRFGRRCDRQRHRSVMLPGHGMKLTTLFCPAWNRRSVCPQHRRTGRL